MALFKIAKGNSASLEVNRPTRQEGFIYLTEDDMKFYIDTGTTDPNQSAAVNASLRKPLNASRADYLRAWGTNPSDEPGTWTVQIPGITANNFIDGLTVRIRLNTGYNGVFNTLNINGLGPKVIYYSYGVRLTSHYPRYAEILLTYRTPHVETIDGAQEDFYGATASSFVYNNIDYGQDGWIISFDNNDYDRILNKYERARIGDLGLSRYKLCVFDANDLIYPISTLDGDSAAHQPLSIPFKPDRIVYHAYSGETALEARSVTSNDLYETIPLGVGETTGAYCRYTFNTDMPTYVSAYLVGTLNENGLFVLDTSATNSWYKYVTTPTTGNIPNGTFTKGKHYLYVGKTYSMINYFQLATVNTLYYCNDNNGATIMPAGTSISVGQADLKKDLDIIETIVGTQTGSTAAWTGTSTKIKELYSGLTIRYFLPYASVSSTNVTLNLTLADGTTTGAINCYYNSGRLTTHYAKGSVITFTYFKKGNISIDGTATTDNRWIADANYDSNSNDLGIYIRYATGRYNVSTDLYRYQLLLQKNETTVIPINTTSNTTGTEKSTITTDKFLISGIIGYYNATGTITANNVIGVGNFWLQYPLDLRYSFNVGTTLTADKDIYLVAVLDDDGVHATLRNSTATNADASAQATGDNAGPITQTLPSQEDGCVYIKLGHAYSTYQITLTQDHPIYWYKAGAVRIYSPPTNKTAVSSTANAVAYYTDTKGTLAALASAKGALYATEDNGTIQFGTLPVAEGGTGRTSWNKNGVVYASDTAALTSTSAGTDNTVLLGQTNKAPKFGQVANAALVNSKITIANHAFNLGDSMSAADFLSLLNLSSAMHFIGHATNSISDGGTEDPGITNYTTKAAGDVIIDSSTSREYVWTKNGAWELLGLDSGYKLLQDAVTDPTSSGTAINFIATITQNANGEITATKSSVRTATTGRTGVLQFTEANTNTQIGTITISDSTPLGTDYFITQTVGESSNTSYRRPISQLWSYIDSQIGSNRIASGTQYGVAYYISTTKLGSTDAGATSTALMGKGSSSAPEFVLVNPTFTTNTTVAATSSAGQKIKISILGVESNTITLTNATTGLYGVTKLNDGISSTSTELAATANSAYTASRASLHSPDAAKKIYLTGTDSVTASTAQDYYDTGVYVTTTAGELSALQYSIHYDSQEKMYMKYNDTDKAVDFIFIM